MLRFLGFGNASDNVENESTENTITGNESVSPMPQVPSVFYLTLVMLNNDSMVKTKVSEKLPRLAGPIMRKAAMRAARARITDESLGLRIGKTFAERLSPKLTEIGVETKVRMRYVAGTIVVVEMKILNVDSLALLDAKAPENAEKARAAIHTASYVGLGGTVQNKLNAKVKAALEEKLQTVLPEMICARLQEKGVYAEAYLRTAQDQASFFFDLIDAANAPGSIPKDESVETEA